MLQLFLFVLLFLSFFSCSPEENTEAPSRDFVIATGYPLGDLDPFSTTGLGASLIELIHPSLFQFSKNQELIPQLVQEYHWNHEKTLLKVKLKGAWAQEVKNSFERAKNPQGGALGNLLEHLQEVRVDSPTEVTFFLKRFDRAFTLALSQLPIVMDQKKYSPLGSFLLQSHIPDQVVLERIQKSDKVVNRIVLKSIPNPRRALRDLVAGEVDLIFFMPTADFEVLGDIEEISQGQFETRILYFLLENRQKNSALFPWKFLNANYDRGLFLREQKIKEWIPAFHPLPEAEKTIISPLKLSNLQQARMPSYPPSTRTLSFLNLNPRDPQLARQLKRDFQERGVDLKLNPLSPSDFQERVFQKRDFDWVLMPVNIKDALLTLYLIFHSSGKVGGLNVSGYHHPEFDQAMEEARFSPDDLQSKQAFSRALQVLMEDPPGLFLYWMNTPVVYQRRCVGFHFNSNEFFSSLKEVRCDP